MFDVFGGGHFGGFRVAGWGVLPEVFESEGGLAGGVGRGGGRRTHPLLSFLDSFGASRIL